jgi:hypothetical protein
MPAPPAAFVSGGFVPAALRGTVNHAYLHAADWYSTLCGLAGVDPQDHVAAAEVPDIDSLDQWPTILTRNASFSDGARQEVFLSYNNFGPPSTTAGYDAALIQGRFKVVTGHQGGSGFWTGPVHPNGTGPADPARNGTACGAFSCCNGCLFDIQSDPTEHSDLRLSMPGTYARLHTRLMELANTTYQTRYIQPGIKCLEAEQAKVFYKGFRGPPCFNASAFPVVPTPAPTPSPPGFFQLASPHGRLCLSSDQELGLLACTPRAGAPLAPQWRVSDPKTGELGSTLAENSLCIKMHESAGWNCDSAGTNATQAYMGHCSGSGGSGAHKTNYFFIVPSSISSSHAIGASGNQSVLIQSHDCPRLCLARLTATSGSAESLTAGEVGLVSCSDTASASASWLRL